MDSDSLLPGHRRHNRSNELRTAGGPHRSSKHQNSEVVCCMAARASVEKETGTEASWLAGGSDTGLFKNDPR